jgi:hypothetical protein
MSVENVMLISVYLINSLSDDRYICLRERCIYSDRMYTNKVTLEPSGASGNVLTFGMDKLDTLFCTLYCADRLETALLTMTDLELDAVYGSAIERRDFCTEYTNLIERKVYQDVINGIVEIRTASAVAVG